jgi:hypothetical protein
MRLIAAVPPVPLDICPVAPGNAQRYVDQISGYGCGAWGSCS